MRHPGSSIPDLMPILSVGRHRSPRQGACFMEFASYLAGEKWSDHPACTHPLVAALARDVNDLTADANRARLVPLVHRVVGLTGDDPLLAATVAVHAAAAALPLVSMERQRALAAGLLSLLRRTTPSSELDARAQRALQQAPDAERWARKYLASVTIAARHTQRAAEAMVHTSVVGIAVACLPENEPDADARLAALLVEVLAACEAILRPAAETRALARV